MNSYRPNPFVPDAFRMLLCIVIVTAFWGAVPPPAGRVDIGAWAAFDEGGAGQPGQAARSIRTMSGSYAGDFDLSPTTSQYQAKSDSTLYWLTGRTEVNDDGDARSQPADLLTAAAGRHDVAGGEVANAVPFSHPDGDRSQTAGAAYAASSGVLGTNPDFNAVGIPLSSNVTVESGFPLSTTSVTTQTFVAQGMMSGKREGTFTFPGGDVLATFNPDEDFLLGEIVRTSLTGGIENSTGDPLTPYQWQFTAGPVSGRLCTGHGCPAHSDHIRPDGAWGLRQ